VTYAVAAYGLAGMIWIVYLVSLRTRAARLKERERVTHR